MRFNQSPVEHLEHKIQSIANKELGAEIVFNKRLYALGISLLKLIEPGAPINPQYEGILLVFLFRALENLRAIELLVKNGYLSQAGSLMANSIELFLLSRKVKTQPKAALQWVNGQRWAITGRNGLCREFKLTKLEKIYSDFSTIKHSQSSASQLNVVTDRNVAAFGILWTSSLAQAILSSNLSAVGDTIRDTSSVLSKCLNQEKYDKWSVEFEKLRSDIKSYYSKKQRN